MPIKTRTKKITRLKKFPILNIGTLMFGIVFVYMIICIVMYLTNSRITAYEVTAGPLSGNHRFTAFALKSEKVIGAEQSGNINYYAREGGKVGAGNNVYSIGGTSQKTPSGGTGTSESEGTAVDNNLPDLDSKSMSKLKGNFATYSNTFDEMSFQNIYNFKADTQSTILELANEELLAELEGNSGNSNSSILGSVYQAPQEGIVVYSVDQFESVTPENISASVFDQKNYNKENLRLKDSVKTGEPVYKLITSEDWSLIIPIDKKLATELGNKDTVRFRFLKDGSTFNAGFSLIQNGKDYFGKLDLSNSVIRYSGERFIEIELVMNSETGLKIPKSAIIDRQFYKIPKEYVTENDTDNEVSILKEAEDKDGKKITKYITATVYDKNENEYFVGTSLFKVGDYILKKDSSKKYQVSETGGLQGVYNINKGYAVFREVEVIDENEEYCIVKAGSLYGLNHYDRIVLDASSVNDEDIVY